MAAQRTSWLPIMPALRRLTPTIIASLLIHTLFVIGISPLIGSAAAHDNNEMPALLVNIADATPAKPTLSNPTKTSVPKTTGDGSGKRKQPLIGTYYYKRSELDQPPGTFNDIAPIYPANADPNGGHVIARVFINESGKADKVLIESATPPKEFDQSVIDAFGNGRYRPGIKNGKAVKSQLKIELFFYPEDAPKQSTKMFKVPVTPDRQKEN